MGIQGVSTKGITTLLAGCAAGAALAGCGAAQTISQAVDPVARAADITAQAPGYRLAGTIQIGVAGKSIGATMNGVFVRRPAAGSVTMHMALPGHALTIDERLAGKTLYIHTPGSTAATGGKPWAKLSLGQLTGNSSLSGLQNDSANPGQFVDFLRAAASKVIYAGPATIRGAATKHYRVTIDLDRYAKLVPAASRAAAGHAVAVLEAALGSHSLPMDVWLDHQGRVRQLQMNLAECVASHRVSMAMTMDFYDFATQAIPSAPPASQVKDVTGVAKSAMQQTPPACPSA